MQNKFGDIPPNMTQFTGEGRTIFLIVMGLNWGREGKDLTQFQQLILIVITKKRSRLREIQEEILLQQSM
jgi:hypothetical protein